MKGQKLQGYTFKLRLTKIQPTTFDNTQGYQEGGDIMRKRIHYIIYIITVICLMLIHGPLSAAGSDIELLEFPSTFYRLTFSDLNSPDMQKIIQSVIPGATAVWYDKKKGVFMVIAGLIPLNKSQVETLSKSQFKDAMTDIGREYQKIYSSKNQVKTSFDVYEDTSLLVLKVTSNFVELGYPNTGYTYIYYYTPNYRMDIVINIRTAHLPIIGPEIQKSMSQLQKRLVSQYPQGIKFRGNK